MKLTKGWMRCFCLRRRRKIKRTRGNHKSVRERKGRIAKAER